MVFTGDVLSHTPVIGQAPRYGAESGLDYDYRPMFAELAPRCVGGARRSIARTRGAVDLRDIARRTVEAIHSLGWEIPLAGG